MYDFEDDGLEDTNSEARYGAVRSNRDYPLPYAAKPAIPAICAMNRLIANSDYTDSVYFNELTSAHRFTDKDSGEQVISIWSSGEDNVFLQLGTEEIEIYDLYGNKIENRKNKYGAYSFNLNDDQYYIKGDFTDFKEASDDKIFVDMIIATDNHIITDLNDLIENGDGAKINITYKNGTKQNGDTKMSIITAYYQDKQLIKTQSMQQRVGQEITDTVLSYNLPIEKTDDTDCIKIFIWDGMEPYCSNAIFQ